MQRFLKKETDMKRQNTIRAIAAALALTALNLTVLGATDATDDINPEDFTVRIDNPFFLLPPRICITTFSDTAYQPVAQPNSKYLSTALR
jgi:hypothetical protein